MTVGIALLLMLIASRPTSLLGEQQTDDLVKSTTKEECMNGKINIDIDQKCCQTHLMLLMLYDPTDDLQKCMKLLHEQATANSDDERSRYLAMVGCYYTKKKFLGRGKNINMQRVRSDAAAKHDPFKRKFLVKMYEDCARTANDTLTVFEANNPSAVQEENYVSRRMYFIFVFMCVGHYSRTTACPYFNWISDKEFENSICHRYAKRCRELMAEKYKKH